MEGLVTMDIGHWVFIDELVKCIKEPVVIEGHDNIMIKGLSPLNEANMSDVSFCTGTSKADGIFGTSAMVIITTGEVYHRYSLPDDKTYILVKNPRLAFIDCLNHFLPQEELKGTKLPNGTVVLGNVKLGNNIMIGMGCVIGNHGFGFERREDGTLVRFPHFGGVIIEDDVEIGSNVCIDRGTFGNTVIGKGTKIDNLVHVAHNVQIGKNCLIVAHAMIAGGVKIGDNCWISSSYIRDGCGVGTGAFVGLGSVVVKDVPPNDVVAGVPARSIKK